MPDFYAPGFTPRNVPADRLHFFTHEASPACIDCLFTLEREMH